MKRLWAWLRSLIKCSCGHERMVQDGEVLCIWCDRHKIRKWLRK